MNSLEPVLFTEKQKEVIRSFVKKKKKKKYKYDRPKWMRGNYD